MSHSNCVHMFTLLFLPNIQILSRFHDKQGAKEHSFPLYKKQMQFLHLYFKNASTHRLFFNMHDERSTTFAKIYNSLKLWLIINVWFMSVFHFSLSKICLPELKVKIHNWVFYLIFMSPWRTVSIFANLFFGKDQITSF